MRAPGQNYDLEEIIKPRISLTVVTLAASLIAAPAFAHTEASSKTERARAAVEEQLVARIGFHRHSVWRLQDRMHLHHSQYLHRDVGATVPLLRRLSHYWEHLHYKVRWVIWPRYQARIAAARAAPTTAGHWSLWSCIHGGEGNGWDHATGKTYSGPLQMTSGWAGYPINDWNTVPIATVYADAEAQFRANGYSIAWLEGQWPLTAPPCLGYA